jgi:hypothetical protein
VHLQCFPGLGRLGSDKLHDSLCGVSKKSAGLVMCLFLSDVDSCTVTRWYSLLHWTHTEKVIGLLLPRAKLFAFAPVAWIGFFEYLLV